MRSGYGIMPAGNGDKAWIFSTLTKGESRALIATMTGTIDPDDIQDFVMVVHRHQDGECDIMKIGTRPLPEWECDIR